jgi:tRNA (guanosine-2'-O-)-methyltransferase
MFMLTNDQKIQLTTYFGQFISQPRKDTIEKVLSLRTKYITIVLEDIFQSQNTSAVIRTCECMGLHEAHIIENKSKYELNTKVLKGANKWLSLIKHHKKGENNTALCYQMLREKGYKILATDPSKDGISISDVAIDQKIAIVMGNELMGTSDFAITHADAKVRIPMYGFTESLNISVSAAICLNTLIPKIRDSDLQIGLREEELLTTRYEWYRKAMRKPDVLERDFLANQNKLYP